MSANHNGAIDSDFDGCYFATCSCGWKGAECKGMKQAEEELMKHYDEVAL